MATEHNSHTDVSESVCFRGVVCVALVSFSEKQKSRLSHHQNYICAQQTNLIVCTSLFSEGQVRISQNY